MSFNFPPGHRIDGIPEVPLVVTDKIQSFTKTKEAVCFLRRDVKAWNDVEQVILQQSSDLLIKHSIKAFTDVISNFRS